jgi:uncharacterized protein with LGFP repeats
LGYPVNASGPGARPSGWIQLFQHGALAGVSATVAVPVSEPAWSVWKTNGREAGALGYPIGSRVTNPDGRGWHQQFQGGFITASKSTATLAVYAPIVDVWVQNARELGPLGYPADILRSTGSEWVQGFEHGAIAGTNSTPTLPVAGVMYAGWVANGGPSGLLKFPVSSVARGSRGGNQQFQGGELWELRTGPVRLVYGSVLTAWQAAGGADGRYGYPLTDTTATGSGQLTCQFEGGTITA